MEDEAEPEPEPGEGEAAHPLRSDHLLSSVTVVVVMSVGGGRGVPRHDVGLRRFSLLKFGIFGFGLGSYFGKFVQKSAANVQPNLMKSSSNRSNQINLTM